MPQDQSSSVHQADMQMQLSDFQGLRAQIAEISLHDVHLGRVLSELFLHLAHLHGFDPAVEDAKAEALARKVAREEEDAQLKAAADARTAARAIEDAQPRTPEQQAALATTRAAEDAKSKEDADALARGRAEEDKLEAGGGVLAPLGMAPAHQAERAEEDAQVKAAADALVKARAAEDAQPHTPEQQADLVTSRAAEDAQVQADADALAKGRAEEDALVQTEEKAEEDQQAASLALGQDQSGEPWVQQAQEGN